MGRSEWMDAGRRGGQCEKSNQRCVKRPGWSNNVAIREITGKPPVGWYYGMVQSKAGVRSRGIVAKTFAEEGLPLKYYSDDYSDDLPHWIERPGMEGDGLLIVPYA